MLLLITFIFSVSSFIYSQPDSSYCAQLYQQLNSENFRSNWGFEKMVEPIGGIDSIQKKLKYPKEALENKIEGKVYVLIIIDSTGNLICPRVQKGLGYGCNEEALRVVCSTKFIPAFYRGRPKTMAVMIPMIFKLPH